MNTQNQSIKGKRIGAAIIDLIIVGVGIGIVSIILSIMTFSIGYTTMEPNTIKPNNQYIYKNFYLIQILNTVIPLLIWFIYYTVFPYFTKGRTLSKLMFGIKVVSLDYQKPSFIQLLFRNIFFIQFLFLNGTILILSLAGAYGLSLFLNFLGYVIVFGLDLTILIMIIATEEGRGFHDYIAKTYVVDKNFDIDKLSQVNALERSQMDWAVFDDNDLPSKIGDDNSLRNDSDQIEILHRKD